MAPREMKGKGQSQNRTSAPTKSSAPKKKSGTPTATPRATKPRIENLSEDSTSPLSAPFSAAPSAPFSAAPARISRRAWEIWQNEGCPEGRDVEHWLRAERELSKERPN